MKGSEEKPPAIAHYGKALRLIVRSQGWGSLEWDMRWGMSHSEGVQAPIVFHGYG